MPNNKTLMQFFEWYVPPYVLWRQIADEAETLSSNGVTALWIPPAYKGMSGTDDVGYSVYDLYDLGEFQQKGAIATKYGLKEELIAAIKKAHKHGMEIYADVVLDHKMGADGKEPVMAREVDEFNRNQQISPPQEIEAWTLFTFPGREGAHSKFTWDKRCFNGVDWDAKTGKKGVFLFEGKQWQDVDRENGNFDYLMGADIDFSNSDVRAELTRWGRWFVHTTDVDGFRFDAVKHMDFTFYRDWLNTLRSEEKDELFSVGEYWNPDVSALENYLNTAGGTLSLFDVPLHYNFYNAATSNGAFDMRGLFSGTLTERRPENSVTFVDNHDTQPTQALASFIPEWFKPIAYAAILLRQSGLPCVFYGDYYGIQKTGEPSHKKMLDMLLRIRKNYAYGTETDYFDHPDIIGWTRGGDQEHSGSGLAVLVTNAKGGQKRMFMGEDFAGVKFFDCTGNVRDVIKIDPDGWGEFKVADGSYSIWLRQQVEVIEGEFCVCRLKAGAPAPDILGQDFCFLSKTDEEVSLVCRPDFAPEGCARECGYSLLRFCGEMDFSLIGVLYHAIKVLAEKHISVFPISTYGTDYIMVKTERLEDARSALDEDGYLL